MGSIYDDNDRFFMFDDHFNDDIDVVAVNGQPAAVQQAPALLQFEAPSDDEIRYQATNIVMMEMPHDMRDEVAARNFCDQVRFNRLWSAQYLPMNTSKCMRMAIAINEATPSQFKTTLNAFKIKSPTIAREYAIEQNLPADSALYFVSFIGPSPFLTLHLENEYSQKVLRVARMLPDYFVPEVVFPAFLPMSKLEAITNREVDDVCCFREGVSFAAQKRIRSKCRLANLRFMSVEVTDPTSVDEVDRQAIHDCEPDMLSGWVMSAKTIQKLRHGAVAASCGLFEPEKPISNYFRWNLPGQNYTPDEISVESSLMTELKTTFSTNSWNKFSSVYSLYATSFPLEFRFNPIVVTQSSVITCLSISPVACLVAFKEAEDVYGPLKIMFPECSGNEELRQAAAKQKAIIETCDRQEDGFREFDSEEEARLVTRTQPELRNGKWWARQPEIITTSEVDEMLTVDATHLIDHYCLQEYVSAREAILSQDDEITKYLEEPGANVTEYLLKKADKHISQFENLNVSPWLVHEDLKSYCEGKPKQGLDVVRPLGSWKAPCQVPWCVPIGDHSAFNPVSLVRVTGEDQAQETSAVLDIAAFLAKSSAQSNDEETVITLGIAATASANLKPPAQKRSNNCKLKQYPAMQAHLIETMPRANFSSLSSIDKTRLRSNDSSDRRHFRHDEDTSAIDIFIRSISNKLMTTENHTLDVFSPIHQLNEWADNLSGFNNEASRECIRMILNTEFFQAIMFLDAIHRVLCQSRLNSVIEGEVVIKVVPGYAAVLVMRPNGKKDGVFYKLFVSADKFKPQVGKGPFLCPERYGNGYLEFRELFCSQADMIYNCNTAFSLCIHSMVLLSKLGVDCATLIQNPFITTPQLCANVAFIALMTYEAKTQTAANAQNLRYMYQEMKKGDVWSFDPFKLLSKFDHKLRSTLSCYLYQRTIATFKAMLKDPPFIRITGVTSSAIKFLDILTGEEMPDSLVMYQSYLGNIHNKNKGSSRTDPVKIIEKNLSREVRVFSTPAAIINGEHFKAGSHSFDDTFVHLLSQLVKRKISSKHPGVPVEDLCAQTLLETICRMTVDNISTTKMSAKTDGVDNYYEMYGQKLKLKLDELQRLSTLLPAEAYADLIEDQPEKQMMSRRLKVIEAIVTAVKQGQIVSHKLFDNLPAMLDSLSPNMVVNLFKKPQHGGPREIYVLPLAGRISVFYLENAAKTVTQMLGYDGLTTTHLKETAFLTFEKARLTTVPSSHIQETMHTADDASKWAQSFKMRTFAIMLSHLYPEKLFRPMVRILNILVEKKIEVPYPLLSKFYGSSRDTEATDELNELHAQLLGLKPPTLAKCGGTRLRNLTNMMQGIPHNISSLVHDGLVEFMEILSTKWRAWWVPITLGADVVRVKSEPGKLCTARIISVLQTTPGDLNAVYGDLYPLPRTTPSCKAIGMVRQTEFHEFKIDPVTVVKVSDEVAEMINPFKIARVVFSMQVSSDDSQLLVSASSIPGMREAQPAQRSNLRVFLRCIYHAKSGIYPRIGPSQSYEKSTGPIFGPAHEFNSNFGRLLEDEPCLIKSVEAAFKGTAPLTLVERQQNFANTRKDMIEFGCPVWIVVCAQELQCLMNYIWLGHLTVKHWPAIASLLLHVSHPSLGFFVKEPALLAGVAGFSGAHLTATKACITVQVMNLMLARKSPQSSGLNLPHTVSVTFQAGQSKKYRAFLRRITKMISPEAARAHVEKFPEDLFFRPQSLAGVDAINYFKAISSGVEKSFGAHSNSTVEASAVYISTHPCLIMRDTTTSFAKQTKVSLLHLLSKISKDLEQYLKPYVDRGELPFGSVDAQHLADQSSTLFFNKELAQTMLNKAFYIAQTHQLVPVQQRFGRRVHKTVFKYQKVSSKFISLSEACQNTWFRDRLGSLAASASRVKSAFEFYSNTFPWLKRTFAETISEGPFLHNPVGLADFITSTRDTDKTFKVVMDSPQEEGLLSWVDNYLTRAWSENAEKVPLDRELVPVKTDSLQHVPFFMSLPISSSLKSQALSICLDEAFKQELSLPVPKQAISNFDARSATRALFALRAFQKGKLDTMTFLNEMPVEELILWTSPQVMSSGGWIGEGECLYRSNGIAMSVYVVDRMVVGVRSSAGTSMFIPQLLKFCKDHSLSLGWTDGARVRVASLDKEVRSPAEINTAIRRMALARKDGTTERRMAKMLENDGRLKFIESQFRFDAPSDALKILKVHEGETKEDVPSSFSSKAGGGWFYYISGRPRVPELMGSTLSVSGAMDQNGKCFVTVGEVNAGIKLSMCSINVTELALPLTVMSNTFLITQLIPLLPNTTFLQDMVNWVSRKPLALPQSKADYSRLGLPERRWLGLILAFCITPQLEMSPDNAQRAARYEPARAQTGPVLTISDMSEDPNFDPTSFILGISDSVMQSLAQAKAKATSDVDSEYSNKMRELISAGSVASREQDLEDKDKPKPLRTAATKVLSLIRSSASYAMLAGDPIVHALTLAGYTSSMLKFPLASDNEFNLRLASVADQNKMSLLNEHVNHILKRARDPREQNSVKDQEKKISQVDNEASELIILPTVEAAARNQKTGIFTRLKNFFGFGERKEEEGSYLKAAKGKLQGKPEDPKHTQQRDEASKSSGMVNLEDLLAFTPRQTTGSTAPIPNSPSAPPAASSLAASSSGLDELLAFRAAPASSTTGGKSKEKSLLTNPSPVASSSQDWSKVARGKRE